MGRLPVSVFESAQSEKKTCIFTIKKLVQMAAKSCSAGWQIIWGTNISRRALPMVSLAVVSPSHGKPSPWRALPVRSPVVSPPRGKPFP